MAQSARGLGLRDIENTRNKVKKMLTKLQRRALIKRAHHMKPELNVGKEGCGERFITSLEEAFNSKDLLKIKLLDNSPEDRDSMCKKLEALKEIELVQNIGLTFILYKELDKEKQQAKDAKPSARKATERPRSSKRMPPKRS